MTEQTQEENQDLPPCPVCGNDEVPCDVFTYFYESCNREVCQCSKCHSIIPTEALKEWDVLRRLAVDERLAHAAELLGKSAKLSSEVCDILRKLLIKFTA